MDIFFLAEKKIVLVRGKEAWWKGSKRDEKGQKKNFNFFSPHVRSCDDLTAQPHVRCTCGPVRHHCPSHPCSGNHSHWGARFTIKLDRLIVLSKSSLLGWWYVKWLDNQIISYWISALCLIIKGLDNQAQKLNYQINQYPKKLDSKPCWGVIQENWLGSPHVESTQYIITIVCCIATRKIRV